MSYQIHLLRAKAGTLIKSSLSGLILLACISTASAQGVNIGNGTGIGLQINQYQRDFGAGISLTSPYIANDKLAFRLRGSIQFHEHVQNNETTWTPYFNTSLGLVAVSGTVADVIRLYSEGGVVGLFPSDEFSSENFVFGGYGLFGFEFFMSDRNNYFIEIGGVGTGAKADQLPAAPVYSNGLLISTGFRIHFR